MITLSERQERKLQPLYSMSWLQITRGASLWEHGSHSGWGGFSQNRTAITRVRLWSQCCKNPYSRYGWWASRYWTLAGWTVLGFELWLIKFLTNDWRFWYYRYWLAQAWRKNCLRIIRNHSGWVWDIPRWPGDVFERPETRNLNFEKNDYFDRNFL